MATETTTATAMGAVALMFEGGMFGKRGILELRDGRFTFRTAKVTLVDAPAADVRDVTLPARSWTGVNPNALFRCTVGGKRYLFALQYLLPGSVADDQVKTVLADTAKRSRPDMKMTLARGGLKLFGMGVGAAIPIVEAVEITEIPEHVLFPEHDVRPEVFRRQSGAVWRQALTGEPIPTTPLPTFWQRHPYLGSFWGSLALGVVLAELIHALVEFLPVAVVMITVALAAILVVANVHRSRAWLTHYLAHDYLIRGEAGSAVARSRLMVFVGAALLFVGLFIPTIDTPDWSHNYLQEHTAESVLLFLCAAGAAYLAYRALHRWAWVPGIVSLLVLTEAVQAERAHAEDIVSQVGTVTYWHWPCTLALFAGTALLLVAPLVRAAHERAAH